MHDIACAIVFCALTWMIHETRKVFDRMTPIDFIALVFWGASFLGLFFLWVSND